MRERSGRQPIGVILLALCWAVCASAQQSPSDAASSLYERSVQLLREGNYSAGIPLARQALEIREQALGAEHPETVAALANLAELHRSNGEYSQAESLHQRALAIRERVLGAEHPDTARSLNSLGIVYSITGAYPKAEALLLRALAIREKVLGAQHPDVARSLNNLGIVYFSIGAYSKAEPLYQRALAIREQALGPDHPETANSLDSLASLYRETGAYSLAEPLQLRGLAIRERALGPEHPFTAGSLNNLGSLYVSTGSLDSAGAMFERALSISEKTVGPEHPDTAICVSNLARVHHFSGAYAQAEREYQRALAIRERALGPEHVETATSLHGLADLYRVTGNYAKAEQLYSRALAIRQRVVGNDHQDTMYSLRGLASLYWAMGNPAKALPLFQRSQDNSARYQGRFLLLGTEARKQDYLRRFVFDVFGDISFSITVRTRGSTTLGLGGVLQYKGRALDAVSDSVERLRRSVRSEDRALFEQLGEVANEFSVLTYQGPGTLSNVAYRQRLRELARQQDALETKLAAQSSEFRGQVATVTVASVRAALPADAALIEWLKYERFDPRVDTWEDRAYPEHYVAYVLKRNGAPAVFDLGPAEDIERLTREFRTAVSNPESQTVKAAALALSQRVIHPLQAQLQGVRHLLLSPDGALNLVPMAALADSQGRVLVERFELTHLTSGRDLLRLAAAEPVLSSNAVVLADPEFGRSGRVAPLAAASRRSAELDRGNGLTFRSLPGAALEAQAIKDLLRDENTRVLTGERATEASLKQLHGPRLLHLATHGFFLGNQDLRRAARERSSGTLSALTENPLLRSGLALAGANERRSGFNDDGILTALEVSRLDLRGTQLVVLSACETGVGEVRNGDGISGLRRALLLAGAQSQVASLWKVADLPTKEIMVSFYRHLVAGQGRAAALRLAQREMLANPQQSHPYYWAAFVSIGAWTPLTPN